jgi:hypothetical protein
MRISFTSTLYAEFLIANEFEEVTSPHFEQFLQKCDYIIIA